MYGISEEAVKTQDSSRALFDRRREKHWQNKIAELILNFLQNFPAETTAFAWPPRETIHLRE
jgi:hypothetical protein